MKTVSAAPRDSASMPPAPLPANRSRNARLRMVGSRIANRVCLTRSPSGRVPSPGETRARPRAVPAITRPALPLPMRARAATPPPRPFSGCAGRLGLRHARQPAMGELLLERLHAGPEDARLVEHLLGGGARVHGELAMVISLERGDAQPWQATLDEAQHVTLAPQLPVLLGQLEPVLDRRDGLQPCLRRFVDRVGHQDAE